ncbi:sensor histidine kinase [Pontibacter harenae]|uniref:sensor histidine kinase n=1 Tax=Pontibacter harenae TaxID=2894083 RepID=UPI001E42275C|nr:ATP-binding protein [Pontibacter harenae]MCC9166533.1 GHKL domain-containing protein [Pontibacter harenae]
MQQVFEDVMADMAFLFDKLQFPCEVSTDFQVRIISLSPKNFRSILYNLLSNSIKYRSNKRNCQVHVQTIQVEKGVVLSVKDDGLGMNEQNLEQLYMMFRRFHSHVEGSGIGLHLVKRIVDSAGGSIEVTSAEDEGTEFKILFKSEAIT